MAVCTSCGNQVEESASFCTSCGKPMPAVAQHSAAITVARPVCSSCGAQADPGSVFCTGCGKRLEAEPVPVDEAAPVVTTAVPLEAETTAPTLAPKPFCTSCSAKLDPGTRFCTNCGQPAADESTNVAAPEKNVASAAPAVEATQPVAERRLARIRQEIYPRRSRSMLYLRLPQLNQRQPQSPQRLWSKIGPL